MAENIEEEYCCPFCNTKHLYPDFNNVPSVCDTYGQYTYRRWKLANMMIEARKTCPPPEQCPECGEGIWCFDSLSPSGESATFKCVHCKNVVTIVSDKKSISKAVQHEVWRRDHERCVRCGGKENLEFDHIKPVSKGGVNTARNIQLLCKDCIQKKQ